MNSDKSTTRSELVGRDLAVLDLKTSCPALSDCAAEQDNLSGPPQVATNQKGEFSTRGFVMHAILDQDESFPQSGWLIGTKKTAGARRENGPTNFPLFGADKVKNLQLSDKKSASVRWL